MKTLALTYLVLNVGDKIEHKTLGYTAIIKKLNKWSAHVEIPDTPQNQIIWEGYKLPKIIKAKHIPKHFKKLPYQPVLNL